MINLQEQLDQRLLQRQARETGICPVREELYAQCFDELIRQVTINCAERGLLLLRVRDEIRMTIAAYQTLYESSIAFGMCAPPRPTPCRRTRRVATCRARPSRRGPALTHRGTAQAEGVAGGAG